MSYLVRAAVMLGILLSITARAQAATFDYKTFPDGSNLISISGRIVAGDADTFKQIAGRLDGTALVALSSAGGLVMEALEIGELIRSKGYATVVPDSRVCASTCGLIWLGGSPRFIRSSSSIGFHAAYTGSADDAKESGVANAMVGADLTKLGLSYQAVAFITSAAPNELWW